MIALSSLISIGRFSGKSAINFLNQVEITSSWENLIDTCTIQLPKNLKTRANNSRYLDPVTAGNNTMFRRGDEVQIQLGYDGRLTERFTGIVSKVSPKVPVKIFCEDDGFRLKQSICPKYSTTGTTIASLLKAILPIDPRTGKQYAFQADPITIGKFTIEKCSVIELLDYLKRHFGFSIYFRDNKIFVGLAYQLSTIAAVSMTAPKVFHFQKNIISDTLEYFRAEDVKYKITVVNIRKDNTRKTFDFGDIDGELRTLNFYDVPDADVKSLALNMLNRFKYTGFRGTFTTFLDPMVRHGEAVRLVDAIIPDRNGVYLVKQVVTTSGINGGRQIVTLDRILT